MKVLDGVAKTLCICVVAMTILLIVPIDADARVRINSPQTNPQDMSQSDAEGGHKSHVYVPDQGGNSGGDEDDFGNVLQAVRDVATAIPLFAFLCLLVGFIRDAMEDPVDDTKLNYAKNIFRNAKSMLRSRENRISKYMTMCIFVALFLLYLISAGIEVSSLTLSSDTLILLFSFLTLPYLIGAFVASAEPAKWYYKLCLKLTRR